MTVSLVTGKFKVLHIGHLRLFNTAAGLSQKLIVALDTSDLNKDEIEWRINLISNISQVNERTKEYSRDFLLLLS
jgi:phosphopantetheine adenylyltransferase